MSYEPLMDFPMAGLPMHNSKDILDEGYADALVKNMKCPVCGKTFAVYSEEHAYTIGPEQNGEKRRKVCSWSCLRRYEREKLAQKDDDADTQQSPELLAALKRQEKCREKVAFYSRRVKSTQTSLGVWRRKLEDADRMLELVLEEEGETCH